MQTNFERPHLIFPYAKFGNASTTLFYCNGSKAVLNIIFKNKLKQPYLMHLVYKSEPFI